MVVKPHQHSLTEEQAVELVNCKLVAHEGMSNGHRKRSVLFQEHDNIALAHLHEQASNAHAKAADMCRWAIEKAANFYIIEDIDNVLKYCDVAPLMSHNAMLGRARHAKPIWFV